LNFAFLALLTGNLIKDEWLNCIMIKGIIFDLGGVYLNRGIRIAFREKFAKMFKLPLKGEYVDVPIFGEHLYPSGFISNKISEEQYWKLCENDLGIKINPDKLRTILLNAFEEQKDVVALVKKLRNRYKLGLLSDMPKEWTDWLENKFHIFGNFDAVVVSGYEGVEKPNPEIYHLILKKLGFKAEECIFIDDWKRNLKYPAKIRMKTILFKNPEQLEKELKEFGIKF